MLVIPPPSLHSTPSGERRHRRPPRANCSAALRRLRGGGGFAPLHSAYTPLHSATLRSTTPPPTLAGVVERSPRGNFLRSIKGRTRGAPPAILVQSVPPTRAVGLLRLRARHLRAICLAVVGGIVITCLAPCPTDALTLTSSRDCLTCPKHPKGGAMGVIVVL